jgi:hypothetical protein
MSDTPVLKRILKRGKKGPDIHILQAQLNQKGYGIIAEDAIFGPKTEDAVKRFQTDHSSPDGSPLKVDGIVGPLTWWALFNGDSPQTHNVCFDTSRLMRSSQEVALHELKKNVREIPPGSNRGPDVEAYLSSVGRNPGDAWCAAFVYWCVERASKSLGKNNPLKRTGRVSSLWADAVERGCVIQADDVRAGEADIPPGAIFCVVYANGRGHTGFVESRNGDTLNTIEGNTRPSDRSDGEGVHSKRRSLSRYKGLKGFIFY